MDAPEFDDSVPTPENSNSTPRLIHCQLPKIKNLFRIIEIFLLLVFFTSASTRLPFAVKITGVYFRQFIGVVVSPLFIFLLSNVIVLTLFFNSRHHHFGQYEHTHTSMETHFEFCKEFIRNGDDHCTQFTHETSFPPDQEVVFQDKETIVQVMTKVTKAHRRRSESPENLRRAEDVEEDRLDTEKRPRRVADGGEVEELSNEDFQRAIEVFIAKQIKFHREEKVAIVLHARV